MRRWIWLTVLLILAIVPAGSEARSHRFLSLDIEAQVGADAVVRITETHTVQFDGTFSGMFQTFNISRGIEIRDVVVSEEGTPYQLVDENASGVPGTYFVRQKGDELLVDWSYSATDEIKKFQVSYTLHNAILKHNDVAEFYYQFVGKEWDQPRDRVRIVLSLPYGAEADQVGAWGYGPRHGQVTVESPQRIVWEVENLPANTFVEGRAVFPNDLVPLGTRYTNENGLDRILGEEQAREERRARTQQRREFDPYAAALLLLLSGLLAVYVWNNYGKPGPGYQDRYYKELPAEYPPAELAILYRRTVQGSDFTATLLDLAWRSYLSIEEITGAGGRRSGDEANYRFRRKEVSSRDAERLRPYEAEALRLLFEEVSDGEVTLEDLQEYSKQNQKSFAAFWKEWGKKVQEAAKEHKFFDEEQGKKALLFLLPGFGLIALGIVAAVLEMLITTFVGVLMGMAVIILSAAASARRSPEGRLQYTKWLAFRRYLKDFSRVDQARVGALGIWEEYLPYAVTLGVADQMLKQLEMRFPNLQEGEYYFAGGWFYYHHTAGLNRISRMTRSVERSITRVTVPQSSSTGGGFSSGGGGGFGGGGGGVR